MNKSAVIVCVLIAIAVSSPIGIIIGINLGHYKLGQMKNMEANHASQLANNKEFHNKEIEKLKSQLKETEKKTQKYKDSYQNWQNQAQIYEKQLYEQNQNSEKKTNNSQVYPIKEAAWIVAQNYVNSYLKNPHEAKFSYWFGDHQTADDCVLTLENQDYYIKGWVDAKNSFGATVRTRFDLTIKYLGGELFNSSSWRLVKAPRFFEQ
jgi:hypothetical protein